MERVCGIMFTKINQLPALPHTLLFIGPLCEDTGPFTIIRRAAEQKATSHSQSVTGAYLQFAGSLVIAVDLQKVVDVYLHLRHLLLLKSRRRSGLASC